MRCGQRSCGVRADPCASVLRSIAHASSIVCSTCAQLAHIWLTLMFLLHVIVCTCVPRLWKVPFSAGVWCDDDHMEGGAAAVATQALREAVRLCVCVGAGCGLRKQRYSTRGLRGARDNEHFRFGSGSTQARRNRAPDRAHVQPPDSRVRWGARGVRLAASRVYSGLSPCVLSQ